MTIPLLEGSRIKIDRAKHHINDLNTKITEFIDSKPYRIVSENDPDTSEEIHVLRVIEEIPKYFSAIIGDAVHPLLFAGRGDAALRR